MDKDVELISYLLRYLHEQKYFRSKQEMAEEFEVSKRVLQRLMNTPEQLKGGSLVLSKVLRYFGEHDIPLDYVLAKFLGKHASDNAESNLSVAAYHRLRFSAPKQLNPQEKLRFNYYHDFLCLLSQYICPTCPNWCKPWNGTGDIAEQNCVLGHIAKRAAQSFATKEVIPDDSNGTV